MLFFCSVFIVFDAIHFAMVFNNVVLFITWLISFVILIKNVFKINVLNDEKCCYKLKYYAVADCNAFTLLLFNVVVSIAVCCVAGASSAAGGSFSCVFITR